MSTVAEDVIVATRAGKVRGACSDGIASFKGIPFAAPPFGPNRFKPPQPPEGWDGIRDALRYGLAAPQTPYAPPLDALLGNQGVPGEDCLNLNVWTPDPSPKARLPVMVWIFGGAFTRGSGAVQTYEGSHFARDGVVLVTINYRLGADGFLHLDDAISNRGLLDQVAALHWVQQNIEFFGGDPSNVTVFGESAGAVSVGSLLAMPAASGLFRRAILQSGAGHHMTLETARLVTENVAAALGTDPTVASMAAVPLSYLLAEQTRLGLELSTRPDPSRWGEAARSGFMFAPIVDGETLPAPPNERIAKGSAKGIDVLIGTNAEEFRFYLVPSGLINVVTEQMLSLFAARYQLTSDGLDVYRRARPGASPGDILAAVITDWFFRIRAIRLAEAHSTAGGAAHMYEFAWRSPLFNGALGACHALEVAFVFDNLSAGGPMRGDHPPQALADAMHRDWVAFARSGDPGWPPYSSQQRAVMRYDVDRPGVVHDPASDERRLWDHVR